MSDPIFLSLLTKMNPVSGLLRQATITDSIELADFDEFKILLKGLAYPTAQRHKAQTYGWVPTIYDRTNQTFRSRKTGKVYTFQDTLWRCAAGEMTPQTLFYGDVDNSDESIPYQSMDDVASRLEMMGLTFLIHTSYSHSASKHKFRLAMPISRYVTREEQARIFVYLNFECFGGQGDPAIYDPGDFVYCPPHEVEFREFGGHEIDIDEMLEAEADLRQAHPEIWDRIQQRVSATKAARSPQRAMTEEQEIKYAALLNDSSIRKFVTIKNPDYWSPAWTHDYQRLSVNKSHWETMRSLMGRAWKKSGGTLSGGEMRHLLREVDGVQNGYFEDKYGDDGRDTLIDWVMSNPVDPPKLKRLRHRNIYDSTLVTADMLTDYANGLISLDEFIDKLVDKALNHSFTILDQDWLVLVEQIRNIKP
jgi:hypothetical protein